MVAEKAHRKKFRFLNAGERRFDAIGEMECVNFFDDEGILFYAHSLMRPNAVGFTYSSYRVPKTLRVEWRTGDCRATAGEPGEPYRGGTQVAEYTIPVADRIPLELLKAGQEGKGGVRLKFRLHDDGVLFGWDLAVPFESFMEGGDFQEAKMVYEGPGPEKTQRWQKGWYIHPKTKQRIETDF